MEEKRKQIVFDLDTNALKIYYPSESWNNAYDVIKRHMTKHGFKWLQGSVYISDKPLSTTRVNVVLDDLIQENPWLNLCMCDCREANIDREHDKTFLFDKMAKIKTREEMEA